MEGSLLLQIYGWKDLFFYRFMDGRISSSTDLWMAFRSENFICYFILMIVIKNHTEDI
jgi:hypothetical protein